MFTSLSTLIHRYSTGRIAIISTIVFVLFMIFVMPQQAQHTAEQIGGTASPDMSFTYSTDELYDMAESYGQNGRDAYVYARYTFDVVWPLVYTFFLATTISWFWCKATSAGSKWRLLTLFPVIGMMFDFLENISTATVMMRYPKETAVLDQLASPFTAIKWIFVNGSFLVLLVGMILAFVMRARRNQQKRR